MLLLLVIVLLFLRLILLLRLLTSGSCFEALLSIVFLLLIIIIILVVVCFLISIVGGCFSLTLIGSCLLLISTANLISFRRRIKLGTPFLILSWGRFLGAATIAIIEAFSLGKASLIVVTLILIRETFLAPLSSLIIFASLSQTIVILWAIIRRRRIATSSPTLMGRIVTAALISVSCSSGTSISRICVRMMLMLVPHL